MGKYTFCAGYQPKPDTDHRCGVTLVGDFYLPADSNGEGSPAVLLMHMFNSRRSAYDPLIPALLDAGYGVLNVDLRGHGESGGTRDWSAGLVDVQTWLNWLREQEGVRDEALSIVGASIGSNLALAGCANDAACLTAVALSPGLDYFGVIPADFLENLSERSALLVASHNDRYSAQSIEELFAMAPGNIAARMYRGGAHGTQLFDNQLESVTALIIGWLDEHNAQ